MGTFSAFFRRDLPPVRNKTIPDKPGDDGYTCLVEMQGIYASAGVEPEGVT